MGFEPTTSSIRDQQTVTLLLDHKDLVIENESHRAIIVIYSLYK